MQVTLLAVLFSSVHGLALQSLHRSHTHAGRALHIPAQRTACIYAVEESDADRIARLQAELAQLQEVEKRLDTDDADDFAGIADILSELEDDEDDVSEKGSQQSALTDSMPSEVIATAAPVAASDTVEAPPNDVPRGGTVAVTGATSVIGQQLFRSLFSADYGWKLRALVARSGEDIGSLAALGVEAVNAGTGPELKVALEDVSALVIISSSAAGGKDGIQSEQVKSLVAAIPDTMRRVIFLSSHGVERTDQLPFNLQNTWGGSLDKLRAAEQEVVLRAMNHLPSYTILRVGKLTEANDGESGTARAELAPGDDLQGELSMTAASQVLVECLVRSESVNASFSAAPLGATKQVVVDPSVADSVHYDDQFVKLIGPEIYRRALVGSYTGEELTEWLQEFALKFLQPGSGLTTPVEIDEVQGGVALRFVQKNPNAGYTTWDQEETDDQKWARAKASSKKSKALPDGALHVLAEVVPFTRVRVVRAEMGPDIVVKAMSEVTILEALSKAVETLERLKAAR